MVLVVYVRVAGNEKTLSNLACGWPVRWWQRKETAIETHYKVVRLYHCFISRKLTACEVQRRRNIWHCHSMQELESQMEKKSCRRKSFPHTDGSCRLCPLSFRFTWPRHVGRSWSRDVLASRINNRQHLCTYKMHHRGFAPPVRLLSLICLALTLAPAVQASLGDRQPEFKSCVAVSSMLLEMAIGSTATRMVVLTGNA
jgi:hypothetical protein